MAKKPKVSIIMPVYNEEKFLDTCISSIVEQSLEDWELICVDDFSTDESWNILGQWSDQDDRISIYRNEEKGIIPALRKAFSYVNGLMITRMDADDIMPVNKLAVMQDELSRRETGHLVSGKVKYFSEDRLGVGFRQYEKWINEQDYYGSIYKECTLPSACWMAYWSDLIKVNAFQKSEYPEDYDLLFRFYKHEFKICSIDQVLHFWRDHPDRASRIDPNYSDQNFFHLKVKYFIELDWDPEKQLIIWGAGRKGKSLVKTFIQQFAVSLGRLPHKFLWITENEKKIGKKIYGIELKPAAVLSHLYEKQVIIAISDQSFTAQKALKYKEYGLASNEIYEFC
ncbi:glycosyltransferase family 2 protein [Portibacter marinus]|uniref:glycosyltransferase family 2 protein n=1 Tax=Portibacter marinus TaxID=2898660 RepID=UPI001F3E13E3|nr:glycosyltransferase family 2 protein [Portibacter marinus]